MLRPSRRIGGVALVLISAVLGYQILTTAFAAEEAVVPARYQEQPITAQSAR